MLCAHHNKHRDGVVTAEEMAPFLDPPEPVRDRGIGAASTCVSSVTHGKCQAFYPFLGLFLSSMVPVPYPYQYQAAWLF